MKLGFKAASAKGVHPYEAAAMAQQLHGPILATAMTKKVGKGGLSESYQSLVQRAERNASAHMIREYRGMLRRGAKRELARGDYALASAEGVLSKLNPAFSLARSRSLTLGGAKAVAARVPRRGTAEVKKLADTVRWHRNNRKLALKNLPHNVNSEQGIFEKLYEGYHY